MRKAKGTALLAGVVALCQLLSAPVLAQESRALNTAPGRILFGQTAQVDEPGIIRATLHELLVAQTLSFVPFSNFELTLGHILPPRDGQSFATAMVRYRFLNFDKFQMTAGTAWLQGYPFDPSVGDEDDSPLDYFPVFELAVTGVFQDFRVNLEALYIMVGNKYYKGDLDVAGIDNLILTVGGEWTANDWLRVFLEVATINSVQEVDSLSDGLLGRRKHFPIVSAGTRFIVGHFSIDTGLVYLIPWVNISVAFDTY